DVVVAGDDERLHSGRRETMHTPGELALMGWRRIARLVDVPGEEDQVDPGLYSAVDGLVQRSEKIVQPLVEASLRVDPAIVLHSDVRVREMGDPKHHRRQKSLRSGARGRGRLLRRRRRSPRKTRD